MSCEQFAYTFRKAAKMPGQYQGPDKSANKQLRTVLCWGEHKRLFENGGNKSRTTQYLHTISALPRRAAM